MVARLRCRSALIGSVMLSRRAGAGVFGSSTSVAISAMPISTATPKNGPRQLMLPSSPPSSGPVAMPTPSAVSYSTIAPAKPPLAEPTMTASEVAMNSALPRPQPARKPTMPSMLPDVPASAENTTIRTSPADQRPLGADPARHPAGDQHHHRGDDQVAGEQQLHLARAGVQLARQRGQDRVDQADAHERDHAREGDRPDRLRLPERVAGARFGRRVRRGGSVSHGVPFS